MHMPALGGRVKVEIDKFEKPSRVYMRAIPTSSKNQKISNQQHKTTMASTLDMFRHGLVHFDIFECNMIGISMQIVYLPEQLFFNRHSPNDVSISF